MGTTPSAEHHEYEYDRLCRLLPANCSSAMGTPSVERDDYDYGYEYDLLCSLLEEGRSWSPPPAATAAPSPSPHGGAPCTTSEPRRRTPAWASAIRGFSNTLCLVILVFLVTPLAMRTTDKEQVFQCVFMFVMSFTFPVLGYVVTWDQP